ncbi:hypothetical protein BD626DRAFT_515541 [Schizophyllum amplum]|uniref:ABM domain-containing protein n=1 Tax=Schizophyllum amplum TaxID=97359 RepID=A0A550BXI9_9AGAR|nr:hypothetical protein BD626DRAFT_515541 [Auriculariopsis ampla]
MTTSLLEISVIAPFESAKALCARDALSGVRGLQRTYIGQQVENPSEGYCVLQWDSLGSRDTFLRSEAYEAYMAHITVERGPYVIYLSAVDCAAWATVITAPIQKFGFFVARTTIAREKARGIIAHMHSGRQERSEKGEITGEMDAVAVDDEDFHVIIDGWESVEQHLAHAARGTRTQTLMEVIAVMDYFSSAHSRDVTRT